MTIVTKMGGRYTVNTKESQQIVRALLSRIDSIQFIYLREFDIVLPVREIEKISEVEKGTIKEEYGS